MHNVPQMWGRESDEYRLQESVSMGNIWLAAHIIMDYQPLNIIV